MASRREQVIAAVKALIAEALPDADVTRNRAKPNSVGPAGTVIIRDGDPGDPEVTLSPLSYTYNHRIVLEVAAFEAAPKTKEEVVDEMLGAIGAAIEADPTLGGVCDFAYPDAPDTENLNAPGAETGRWADAGIIAIYTTTNPFS